MIKNPQRSTDTRSRFIRIFFIEFLKAEVEIWIKLNNKDTVYLMVLQKCSQCVNNLARRSNFDQKAQLN